MTPLRQQRANRAMTRLHFQLLYPKLKAAPEETIPKEPSFDETATREIVKICHKLGFSMWELRSPSRTRHLAYARMIVTKHLVDELEMGWSEIGKLLNRTHGTIISQYKQYNNLKWSKDKGFMKVLNRLNDYDKSM